MAGPPTSEDLVRMRAEHISPDSYSSKYDIVGGGGGGSGAFGVVKEGVERGTTNRVAVKFLNEASNHLPRDRRDACLALLQEVDVLKRVKHLGNVNILRILGAFEEPGSTVDGVPRIIHVTDFCAGGELFERLTKPGAPPLTETRVATIIAKIARAVQQLHGLGIVHRDLKSENILFMSAEDGAEPVLSDLGLALILGRRDPYCGVRFIGTYDYCAPEVLGAQYEAGVTAQYSPASDVWTLGTVLFVMLTGSPPFGAHDAGSEAITQLVYSRIRAGAYGRWHPWVAHAMAALSAEARDLFKHIFAVNPEHRITLAQLLEHPFITRNYDTAALPMTVENMRRFVMARRATTAAGRTGSPAPLAAARAALLSALGGQVRVPAGTALAAGAGAGARNSDSDDAAAAATFGLRFLSTAQLLALPRLFRGAATEGAASAGSSSGAGISAGTSAAAGAVAGAGGSASSSSEPSSASSSGAGAAPSPAEEGPFSATGDSTESMPLLLLPQFTTLMSKLGLSALPVRRIFELLDRDRDGTVNYLEFAVGLAALHSADDHELALRVSFTLFTDGKSGYISREGLAKLLRRLHADELHGGSGALATAGASTSSAAVSRSSESEASNSSLSASHGAAAASTGSTSSARDCLWVPGLASLAARLTAALAAAAAGAAGSASGAASSGYAEAGEGAGAQADGDDDDPSPLPRLKRQRTAGPPGVGHSDEGDHHDDGASAGAGASAVSTGAAVAPSLAGATVGAAAADDASASIPGSPTLEDALARLFAAVDGSHDGRISFQEFTSALGAMPALRPFLLAPVHFVRARMAALGAAIDRQQRDEAAAASGAASFSSGAGAGAGAASGAGAGAGAGAGR